MSMSGVVVVVDGVVVVVVLGLLVDRVLVGDGTLVVLTRGVVEEVGDCVDVRSDDREALLGVPREVGVPVLAVVLVSAADSEAESDFAFAGAASWLCGSIRASTGTAVSPPIQSSTSPGNGCQLPGRPASRRWRPSSRV
jgi:hypothetical protein